MPRITLNLDGEKLEEWICDMCNLNKSTRVAGVVKALRLVYVVCDECWIKLPERMR